LKSEMKIQDLFKKASKQIVAESKVLVCSIESQLEQLLESDRDVYSKYYRSVDSAAFRGINELLTALETGYDIVHLFVHVSPGGLLAGGNDISLLGTDLIRICSERNVKLLWIASENNPDDYVKGFKVAGNHLNLIMTINRNRTKFTDFLETLLSAVSTGETLPVAWMAVAPQAGGTSQRESPSCIFYAGRPDAKLLP